MPRKKKVKAPEMAEAAASQESPAPDSDSPLPDDEICDELSPTTEVRGTEAAGISLSPAPAAVGQALAADPRPWLSVNLCDYSGGPSMHLLRSHRFKQMQIRFDYEEPSHEQRGRLREAGWRDRSEEEGIWTKQIDPAARWQSVAQMEQEFKAVANAMREEKGLEPTLDGIRHS
jgi:hypothetical protein